MAQGELRVLHVVGAMDRGGAEMRLLSMARMVRGDQIVFDYCTLSGRRGRLEPEVLALNGRIFPTPMDVVFPWRFLRLIRSLRPDAVHAHVQLVSGFILMFAFLAGVRVRVAHSRNTSDGVPEIGFRRLRNLLLRGMIRLFATDVFAVSKGSMVEGFGRWTQYDRRCRVIYNGFSDQEIGGAAVDRELLLGKWARGKKVLVQVGNARREKNRQFCVGVLAELRNRGGAVVLLYVGRDNQEDTDQIEKLAAAAGVSDAIRFLGERSDVVGLLKMADVSLLPSLWEGLPGSVLESCLCGTPVVASDIPGVREIAETFADEVAVVPLEAGVEKWAEAVERALVAGRRTIISAKSTRFDFEKSVFEQASVWTRYRGR